MNGNGNGAASAPSTNAPPGFDAYSDLHVAYDLIVSDGKFQLKVLLSPTLTIHLEKGGILPNGVIQITEATVRYDETVVASPGFYLIRQMNILAPETNNLILVRKKKTTMHSSPEDHVTHNNHSSFLLFPVCCCTCAPLCFFVVSSPILLSLSLIPPGFLLLSPSTSR